MKASLAIVLINYRRPQNIGRIVAAARAGLPEAPIFLLDQAETDDLRLRDDVAWPQVWYCRAAENKGAGARVPLAATLPFEGYIAVDDDVFLEPPQIAALAAALEAEPHRAHGVAGQRIGLVEGEIRLGKVLSGVKAPVSVLNMVYAFSRTQAEAAIALAARLGWPRWDEIGPIDDMLLSCASAKTPPLCHDLGQIWLCASADEPGVAVWRSEGFDAVRHDAARRLIDAGAMPLFKPKVGR